MKTRITDMKRTPKEVMMTISPEPNPAQMSRTEVRNLEAQAKRFNANLKETQKIVSKSQMSEADFLNLLVTQLQNQDPTKPMEDKEFIGQMAQFTSLKQMSQMAENMATFTKASEFNQSVALLGQSVVWKDADGNLHTGIVDGIDRSDAGSSLRVDGQKAELANVQSIRSAQETSAK